MEKLFRTRAGTAALVVGLALAALAAYANHFQNDFQFDDSHTITDNPNIRDLRNVPRFFQDGSLFSIYGGSASYRPATSVSLAIDYWLGHGLKPFYFHLSTFVWFTVQLMLMFFLYRRIMDAADAHPSNVITAALVTACYGLHPANAETVNYIIQRGDLYNTLGVVASLLCFIAFPGQRKRGWYLLPAVTAYLAKAPALIYPFILLAYIFLFEQDAKVKKWQAAVSAVLPALLVTAAAGILTAKMTPPTFAPGAASPSLYRLTQPWAALHYFKSFFLPTELSADNGWVYVSGPFSGEALAGYLFVAALLAAAIRAARERAGRPIAFGILWFFLALLPTSLTPLADVANDHRMFFPFVGLALAAGWSLRLPLFRKTGRLTMNPVWVRGALAASLVVLAAAGVGTRQRNQVWHTPESLWRDVTIKNPQHGRGWMGYGTVLQMRGDHARAVPMFERAERLGVGGPNVYFLAINMAKTYAALGRDDEAAKYFERAEALSPDDAQSHFLYAQWLREKGRLAESRAHQEDSVRAMLRKVQARNSDMAPLAAVQGDTAQDLVNQSAEFCKAGRYAECYAVAVEALRVRPGFAEAYNNMAAALFSMERWDEGIAAAQQALTIKPDYEAARSNLEWGLEHQGKRRSSGR